MKNLTPFTFTALSVFVATLLSLNPAAQANIRLDCESTAGDAAMRYEDKSGNACGVPQVKSLRLAKEVDLSKSTSIQTFEVLVASGCNGEAKYEVVLRNGRKCRLQSVMQSVD